MNTQVFVAGTAALNTKETLADLGAGEIGLFGISRTSQMTVRAHAGEAVDGFFVAAGKLGIQPKIGRTFDRDDIRQPSFSVQKAIYRAPRKEKLALVIDCLGTGAFDTFTLSVSTKFKTGEGGQQINIERFTAVGKFLTDDALYAALVADFQSRDYSDVVVTSNATSVIVETVQPEQTLEASLSLDEIPSGNPMLYSSCNATVTTLVEGDSGSGTALQLRAALRQFNIWDGGQYVNDRNVPYPAETNASFGDGSQFHIYDIGFDYTPSEGNAFHTGNHSLIWIPVSVNTTVFDGALEFLTGKSITLV